MAQSRFYRVIVHAVFFFSHSAVSLEAHFHVQPFRTDGIQGADGNNSTPAPDAMRRTARVLFYKNRKELRGNNGLRKLEILLFHLRLCH